MKNRFIKLISLVLVVAFAIYVAAVPVGALTFDNVSATQYATYKTAANSISSSYAGSQYYKNFRNVPITGDARTDVLAVALSQVGYQESTSGDYDGEGNGTSNYTEYNYNMGAIGSYAYAWCATFVSWSLLQGRATTQNTQSAWARNHFKDSTYIWREVGCSNWALQLMYCGYFQKSAYQGGSYVPQPGDLIFFSWESALYGEDHIGIVVHSDGSKVWTIEGNTSSAEGLDDEGGGVYFKSYSTSYSCITGYGVLPYATADVPDIDYSGANPTTGIYMATSGAKSVYSDLNSTSSSYTLPKFSMFEVLDVQLDSNGKTKLYSKCEISGSTVYGWIYHGSATNGYSRTVQIYANPGGTTTEPEPEPTPQEEWTFDKVSGNFATYRAGANDASDSYKSGLFYERYTNVPLTGDKRTDAVAIALSQVGYKDSATEDYDGVSSTTGNYTEYNRNMGDFGSGFNYGWSASFVSWVLYQSRATDQNGQSDWCRNHTDDTSYIWCEVGCSSWATQLESAGYLEQSAQNGGTYIPQSGDLIFFTTSSSTHIGIVVYCDGTTVWTVEGNTTEGEGVIPAGESVCVKSYALDYEYISSYGKLPYEEDDSVTPVDYSGAAPTTGVYMTATGSKPVYAEMEDTSSTYVLPKFEMLEVLEIKNKADGTTMLYSKCRIDGVIVYGWIESDASDDIACVIQIYANPAPDLLSDVYDITDKNLIKGVSVNTTLNVLIGNVTTKYTVKLFKGETELALDAKLGTGMVLKTMDGDTVIGTYTIVVKGDVNGDTKVSGIDYLIVKRHILKITQLQGSYHEAGLIVRDDNITAYDYLMIKRYVLGTYQL